MAFAGHVGVSLDLPPSARNNRPGTVTPSSPFAQLFAEELGAVIQVREADLDDVSVLVRKFGFKACTARIGSLNPDYRFVIRQSGQVLLDLDLSELRAVWSDTTRRISALRDNPACAESEYQLKLDRTDPGITPKLTFSLTAENAESAEFRTGNPGITSASSATSAVKKTRPPIAILREQGVNGEVEMAAAFTRAGFRAIDVHMTDILSGRISLKDFRGLAACGGFSYGDVLGAGEGWAKSILFNDRARAEFSAFFARPDTFALGVCNGCQMMSNLHSIIPGAEHWPHFVQNRSERFEARFASIQIEKSPSILFAGMEGSVIPIAVSHGEGYAEFADAATVQACSTSGLVVARFVDNHHQITEQYPLNPNGSPLGLTALTTRDGRVTIMMPHPERVHRTVTMSYHPADWGEDSPWMKLFYNARAWVG